MRFGFLNNFAAQLAAPVADDATEIELSTGAEAIATALENADAVALTLFVVDAQGNETKREVVYATAVTESVVTVEREQEDSSAATFTAGDGVEARLTARALSSLMTLEGEATGSNSLTLGRGTQARQEAGVAIGPAQGEKSGAGSFSDGGVAIGAGSAAYGERALALAGGSVYGANSVSIGDGSEIYGANAFAVYGSASSEGGIAVGVNANASGAFALALMLGSAATSLNSLAIGVDASANAESAIALGEGSVANGDSSIAVGVNAAANIEAAVAIGKNAEASSGGAVALGLGATANRKCGIALGEASKVTFAGGMQVNALSYIPAAYDYTAVAGYGNPPENTTRQAALQVVIATEPLDLTDDTATATLTLPTNSMLFPDAFDLVVIDADSAGGAPEIQIGPDDTDPADYLAATAISKTAIGGRETFEPLISDGVTTLRVSVAAAGSGTLSAKVVVRGYVMEL